MSGKTERYNEIPLGPMPRAFDASIPWPGPGPAPVPEAQRQNAKAGLLYDGRTAFASRESITAFADAPTAFADRSWLDQFDQRLDVAVAVAKRAGLPVTPGRSGLLRLTDAVLDLSIWQEPGGGRWVFRVNAGWPTIPARESLIVAELYTLLLRSECKLFPPRSPLLARVRCMMLIDLGFVEAPDPGLAPLPADASADETATWQAVERLLAARRLSDPEEELFPFSATVSRLLGVDEKVVRRGKEALERRGYLVRAGSTPSGYPHPTVLWRALRRSTFADPGRAPETGLS